MMEDVTRRFDAELRKLFRERAEVLRYLLNHERKRVCIRNLCVEISRAAGFKIDVNVHTYDRVIREFARMFARAALQFAEEKSLSKNEVTRLQNQANKLKDAEETFRELERELLHEHRDEDWAKKIKAERTGRATD